MVVVMRSILEKSEAKQQSSTFWFFSICWPTLLWVKVLK